MQSSIPMKIIATLHGAFPTKFGIPRQSGLVEDLATVVFEPEYRNPDALRGGGVFPPMADLVLSPGHSSALVPDGPSAPPGRKYPNGGLRHPFPLPSQPHWSVLSPAERNCTAPNLGPVLHVAGADLMDGTPIFDIKPYLPYTDAHPQASSGFTADYEGYHLTVRFPEDLLEKVPLEKQGYLGACWPKTLVLPTRKTPHGLWHGLSEDLR